VTLDTTATSTQAAAGAGWDASQAPPSTDQTSTERRPSVQPWEILGGQSFDTNVNEQGVGGPGLWTAPLDSGIKTYNQIAQEAWKLTPAEVEDLQQRLLQAGYYSDQVYAKHANPEWGHMDDATQEAYYNALLDASRKAGTGQTLEDHLVERAASQRDRLARLQTSALDTLRPRLLTPDVVNLSNITVDDPAALRETFRRAAKDALGMDLSDDEADRFAASIRGEQVAQGERIQGQQRAVAEARAAQERSTAEQEAALDRAQALGPDATTEEIKAFRDVIQNEVVGPISAFAAGSAFSPMGAKINAYGVDSETLAQWAAEARARGVVVPALSTPQAVDLVVDNHLRQLYKETGGDWHSVAIRFAYDVDQSMKRSRGGRAFGGQPSPLEGPIAGMAQRTLGTEARRGQMPADITTPSGATPIGTQARRGAVPGVVTGGGPTQATINEHIDRSYAAQAAAYAGRSQPTELDPLASQIVASMNRMLGREAGTPAAAGQPGGGGVIGSNAPVFAGGAVFENIDPAARAQEQLRREHGGEIEEYQLMGVMRTLESLLGSAG